MRPSERWPLERVLFALAGTITLLSAVLAAVVSPWFLLLTAFVGVNQWLYVARRRVSGVGRAAPGVPAALRRLSRRRGQSTGGDGRDAALGSSRPKSADGWIGRYTATHFRVVARRLAGGRRSRLGFFAPRVETALSGAGWETTGSQSVQARNLIDKNFRGLSSYALMTVIYSPTATVTRSCVQGRRGERRADAAHRQGGRVRRAAGAGRLDFA